MAPRRNSRSPFTRQTWSRIRTERKPTVRIAVSLTRPSTVATSRVSSHRGWSPSSAGHQSGGRGTRTDHSTRFSPPARGCPWRWSMPRTRVRNTTGRGRSVWTTARIARVATFSVARVQTTRRWRRGTGPVSRRRTGRQMPPGFHPSGSPWVAPVSVRFSSGLPTGGQVTSTASRWSERRRASSVTSRAWGTK